MATKRRATKKPPLTRRAPKKKANGPPKKGPGRRRPDVNWERVEADWRSGIMTPTAIMEKHGISKSSLTRNMKQRGAKRDLGAAVKAAMALKLAERGATEQAKSKDPLLVSAEMSDVVDQYADLCAAVVESHRADLKAARSQTQTMFAQLGELLADVTPALEATVLERDQLVAEIAEEIRKNPKNKELRVLALSKRPFSRAEVWRMKASMLGTATGMHESLVRAIERLINSDRKAYGLDDEDGAKPLQYDDLVQAAHDMGMKL